ncbi:alpha/beta fold hydrolase [Amycolatopsis methanolica]|uniref:Transcriptional regulator, CadC n=1 Tax=Amycolatopsis methanolica 239 TaxID=1068978 RepID=A0A076MUW3_AMYME|nr:alpha/beta hydrolase [Amycolatopsis methanolica]AIJ24539.1 transcriptional regulator, CadC [Amycolatopsis methanolica 239]
MQQQIRYCRSPNGVRVAYGLSGCGPPLVKAANWLTHLDLEWTSPIWAHWLDGLARRHTLVRYDERGCGLSDWDIGGFRFDDWVDDLELLVDGVGLDRFPLLGISQGGVVAIAYAVRHPERVSRLVLAGACSRGRFARAAAPEEKEEAQLDLVLGRIGWQRATTSNDNVVRFLDVFAHIDVSAIVPSVHCPTLILHSRGDLRVPKAQAQELAALTRTAGCGRNSSTNWTPSSAVDNAVCNSGDWGRAAQPGDHHGRGATSVQTGRSQGARADPCGKRFPYRSGVR